MSDRLLFPCFPFRRFQALPAALNAAVPALLLLAASPLSTAQESRTPDPGKPAAAPAASGNASAASASAGGESAGEVVKIDFSADEAGELPSDYMVSDAEAKFSIEADGANKLLRMSPSPIVDGGVLVGKSIKGGAVVSARIRAEGKRRSFPRFGVGLHGVSGYRLLASPADKELQLMKDDAVVAQVPLTWKSGAWTQFEFSLSASADGGSAIEGRVWEEGQTRPAAPQLSFSVKTPPATGKASVWAAPYSGTPVDFDDITVTAKP